MVNESEEIQFHYEPEKEFTLKGSINENKDFYNDSGDNLSDINNNKNKFENIKIIDNTQKNNYKFNNIDEKFKNNYILNNNNIHKIIQDNINENKSLINKGKNTKISNNNHFYSKINNYWAKREKINRIKMEKIKKEREQKLYGNLYKKPKINKHSQEIINRIKENLNSQFSEEEQLEDEINNNIPIKTEQRKIDFQNNNSYKNKNMKYINNNGNITTNSKTCKDFLIINSKDSYARLMKLKKDKKRGITPKAKNINLLSRKKNLNNYNNYKKENKINKILRINEIKNLKKINRLRKEQENERIQNLQNKENIEKIDLIENKTKAKEEISSLQINKDFILNQKKENNGNKGISIDLLNNNMKLISERIKLNRNNTLKSEPDFQNRNLKIESVREEDKMSNIMRQRKLLNEIYNNDKRIINHSYIQAFLTNETKKNEISNQRKIKKFYKNNQILTTKSFNDFNNLLFHRNLNIHKNINKKTKSKIHIINHFEDNKKSMNSKHYYTDNNIFHNNTFNNNRSLKYINLIQNKKLFKNNNQLQKFHKNMTYHTYNNENKENYKSFNNLNNMNIENYFNKFINRNNNDFNFLNKEKGYHAQNTFDESYQNNNLNKNTYINNVLQNKSIDDIFNELNNETLLKYRKENEQKLKELNQKIRNKRNLTKKLVNKINESNNYNKFDENIFRTINAQKIKNVLNSEGQKLENSLDYYNKELILNKKKRDFYLNEIYGSNSYNYKTNLIFKNNAIDNKNINNETNGINYNNNVINIYQYDDILNKKNIKMNKFDNEIVDNYIGPFKFQRNYKL